MDERELTYNSPQTYKIFKVAKIYAAGRLDKYCPFLYNRPLLKHIVITKPTFMHRKKEAKEAKTEAKTELVSFETFQQICQSAKSRIESPSDDYDFAVQFLKTLCDEDIPEEKDTKLVLQDGSSHRFGVIMEHVDGVDKDIQFLIDFELPSKTKKSFSVFVYSPNNTSPFFQLTYSAEGIKIRSPGKKTAHKIKLINYLKDEFFKKTVKPTTTKKKTKETPPTAPAKISGKPRGKKRGRTESEHDETKSTETETKTPKKQGVHKVIKYVKGDNTFTVTASTLTTNIFHLDRSESRKEGFKTFSWLFSGETGTRTTPKGFRQIFLDYEEPEKDEKNPRYHEITFTEGSVTVARLFISRDCKAGELIDFKRSENLTGKDILSLVYNHLHTTYPSLPPIVLADMSEWPISDEQEERLGHYRASPLLKFFPGILTKTAYYPSVLHAERVRGPISTFHNEVTNNCSDEQLKHYYAEVENYKLDAAQKYLTKKKYGTKPSPHQILVDLRKKYPEAKTIGDLAREIKNTQNTMARGLVSEDLIDFFIIICDRAGIVHKRNFKEMSGVPRDYFPFLIEELAWGQYIYQIHGLEPQKKMKPSKPADKKDLEEKKPLEDKKPGTDLPKPKTGSASSTFFRSAGSGETSSSSSSSTRTPGKEENTARTPQPMMSVFSPPLKLALSCLPDPSSLRSLASSASRTDTTPLASRDSTTPSPASDTESPKTSHTRLFSFAPKKEAMATSSSGLIKRSGS